MEQVKLTITAESPLCFSERRPAGQQFRESTEYVPGAVLRAAVAMLMLRDDQEENGAFQHLFASDRPAVFTNAYPVPAVLPATAMTCKAERGFRANSGHGVIDTLIDRLCFEALEPAGLLYQPRCRYAECRMRMERYKGFYRPVGQDLRAEKMTQRLLTRVAINRRRAVAEDELLYSPLVISEGTYDEDGHYQETQFHATVKTHAHADVVEEMLSRVEHLGSGASRGLGRVKITSEWGEINIDQEINILRQRRDRLNDGIKKVWDLLCQLPGRTQPSHNPGSGAYFPIGFTSDAILKDDGWLPTMILSEQMLKEHCDVNDPTLQLVRSYSGYEFRGGWNIAWGLPKEVDVVVPMGSVFVFWTEHPDRWERALLNLEWWGIGERTAEGFGQVSVCDEFHYRSSSS